MANAVGPLDVFRQGLAQIFQSNEFSDFEIRSGSQSFKVHKAVICAQSAYFRAPCAQFKESEANVITLKAIGDDPDDEEGCDDPAAVKLMVDFFYHFDYSAPVLELAPKPVPATSAAANTSTGTTKQRPTRWNGISPRSYPTSSQTSTDGNTVVHAKVFAAAVKYKVPALRALATAKFKAAAERAWNEPSFAEAAHFVYTSTPEEVRELRNLVADAITTHKVLLDTPEMEAAIRSIGGLAYELLRKTQGLDDVPASRSEPVPVDYGGWAICASGPMCANCGLNPRGWGELEFQ